jgi:hypothetical protein
LERQQSSRFEKAANIMALKRSLSSILTFASIRVVTLLLATADALPRAGRRRMTSRLNAGTRWQRVQSGTGQAERPSLGRLKVPPPKLQSEGISKRLAIQTE